MINHVYGNTKINILKNLKKFIALIILLFLSFFYRFNKNQKIIISSAMYAPWLADTAFFKLYSKLKFLTIVDEARAFTLWYMSQSLKNINGDIYDVGCMKGGAGILMSKANKNSQSKTYFIDTFEGYSKSSGEHKKNKTFVYNKTDELQKNLINYKIKNFKITKLRFPKNFKFKSKIKLCHLDINVYEDTVKAFVAIDKYLIKNGVIIFDDYGIFKVDGIIKSVNKILKKGYDKNYHVIYNYMGQCIMIKK
tara:strand:- start:316 stop:1068 length:753 start_codon:yes stop_codon:yes gene_type:complete